MSEARETSKQQSSDHPEVATPSWDDRPVLAAAASTPPRRRIRTLLTAAMLLAAACTGAGAIPAEPASADVGGCWGSCTGSYTIQHPPGGSMTSVTCSAGRIVIAPSASAMAGYTQGQLVSYRYNLQSNRGHNGTSGWSSWTTAPSASTVYGATIQTPLTYLPAATVPAPANTTWRVQVQFVRWTGTYAYSAWTGPTGGYQIPPSQILRTTCPT